MQINKSIHLLLIIGILIGLISMSAVAKEKESAREYIKDSVITTKVVAKLTSDSSVNAKDIITNTFKKNVQLCGFVDRPEKIKTAENIVQNIKGIKNVYNDLIAITDIGETNNSSVSDYGDDTLVTANVKSALFNQKQIPSGSINVVTHHGYVALCGFVNHEDIKETAERIAKEIKNVKEVKNNLRVK